LLIGEQPIIAVTLPIRAARRKMIGSTDGVIGDLPIKFVALECSF
jgi:hypothetical protein